MCRQHIFPDGIKTLCCINTVVRHSEDITTSFGPGFLQTMQYAWVFVVERVLQGYWRWTSVSCLRRWTHRLLSFSGFIAWLFSVHVIYVSTPTEDDWIFFSFQQKLFPQIFSYAVVDAVSFLRFCLFEHKTELKYSVLCPSIICYINKMGTR